jgi:hypothetical protein
MFLIGIMSAVALLVVSVTSTPGGATTPIRIDHFIVVLVATSPSNVHLQKAIV